MIHLFIYSLASIRVKYYTNDVYFFEIQQINILKMYKYSV
jgi:hypothetical protein